MKYYMNLLLMCTQTRKQMPIAIKELSTVQSVTLWIQHMVHVRWGSRTTRPVWCEQNICIHTKINNNEIRENSEALDCELSSLGVALLMRHGGTITIFAAQYISLLVLEQRSILLATFGVKSYLCYQWLVGLLGMGHFDLSRRFGHGRSELRSMWFGVEIIDERRLLDNPIRFCILI